MKAEGKKADFQRWWQLNPFCYWAVKAAWTWISMCTKDNNARVFLFLTADDSTRVLMESSLYTCNHTQTHTKVTTSIHSREEKKHFALWKAANSFRPASILDEDFYLMCSDAVKDDAVYKGPTPGNP